MAFELRIPSLGAAMTEGTLVQWHKSTGDTVARGDLVYTLETEKTAQDVEATEAGIIKQIGKEGEIYPVGELIGLIE